MSPAQPQNDLPQNSTVDSRANDTAEAVQRGRKRLAELIGGLLAREWWQKVVAIKPSSSDPD